MPTIGEKIIAVRAAEAEAAAGIRAIGAVIFDRATGMAYHTPDGAKLVSSHVVGLDAVIPGLDGPAPPADPPTAAGPPPTA